MRQLCRHVLGAMLALVLAAPAFGQIGQLDLGDLGGNAKGAADGSPLVAVSAAFSLDKTGRSGRLAITAKIAEGWHIYSITQLSGGPVKSKIKLDKNPGLKVTGDFTPSPPPESHVDDLAFKGLALEEHAGTVTWTAPIELAADTDPTKLKITGKLSAQTCRPGQCLFPKDFAFASAVGPSPLKGERTAATDNGAKSAGSDDTLGGIGLDGISFRGHVSPKTAVPGGKVSLAITAEPAGGWHIYELSDKPATATGAKPTLLVLTKTSGLKNGPAVADQKPLRDPRNPRPYFDEKVTWTVEMTVPKAAKPGPIDIEGLVAYQICTSDSCKNPSAIGFAARLAVGDHEVAGDVSLKFDSDHRYNDVEKLVKNSAGGASGSDSSGGKSTGLDLNQLKPAGADGAPTSLALMLGFGFLGGLILNLMPCVLPVIGLKILSFLEQSHHSRRQAFVLNLWYSLGMMAVFMALATLPVISRLWFNQSFGWGQQFSFVGFNVALAAVVFVMALSFLGVWEIPIPGFVGGSKANQLAAQEGFSGAFAKGAITTVLATPCSGPFLGTALGFALVQPPLVIYLMFASIGLGMASPYLLIGAFPQLMRWLPKPGVWMDTFKQLMGFVLLGTVVYLMTLIRVEYFVPTLTLLFGLWAGCWWINRTPLYAEPRAKAQAWAIGSLISACVGVFAFQVLAPQPEAGLAWRPFSLAELSKLTAEGKTVMLDFTADWCPTCKFLEHTVLNTADTKAFIERHGIVPMVADITLYPDEAIAVLDALTSKSRTIPVLAIYPAGRPNEPIVLQNAYTRGLLFQKLKEAGPSTGQAQLADLPSTAG